MVTHGTDSLCWLEHGCWRAAAQSSVGRHTRPPPWGVGRPCWRRCRLGTTK